MSVVYFVEDCLWGDYTLHAVYDNKQAAMEHVADPNFQKKCSNAMITEVGVRSTKQLKDIHEVTILDRIENAD